MRKELLLSASLLVAAPIGQALADEACYGVVLAGENECSTSTNACAGHSLEDGLKDAYIYVPNGICLKLVGGSLEPDQ